MKKRITYSEYIAEKLNEQITYSEYIDDEEEERLRIINNRNEIIDELLND